jgi:hypothetical protein
MEGPMIDRKKFRESIGYTQARQSKDSEAWRSLADGYYAATKVLNEHRESIPNDTRPFALNAGLSLELIFKSILAKKDIRIPQGIDGHDLSALSEKAGLKFTSNQKLTLELLTEAVVWSGRYPAPKKEQRWDDYQDRIFEAHVVRQTVGNVSSARANPGTFPNWENYSKIWEACLAEFSTPDR